MADASGSEQKAYAYVDVLRCLKRAINKGGKLYNAGDYSGCYATYLSAADEITQHSSDEDIRNILDKAKADVLQLNNPTEQAWGLRVAFDQIKDRGRASTPRAASSAEDKEEAARAAASAEDKEEAAKAAKKVMHVCREVHETEAAYVADLQTIIHIFMHPVSPRIIDEQASAHIFSNIEDLLRCNTALLEALQPLERAAEGSDVVGVIASAFLAVAPFFKLYTAYCQNYELGLKTLSSCRQSNPQLNAFLATQMQLPKCHGLTLESFLIKPVQRLTKYPLFFKDLLREIPRSHPSYASLTKAANLVSEVSQSVDARLSDPSAKMAERLQPLGAEWLNLLAPHREMCLEFYCTIQTGSGHRFPAVGYLFTDLLLLCKRKDKSELKPWLLESLPQCLVGDHALLEAVAENRGLWSEEVQVATEASGMLFRKKGPAEKRQEWVLAVRVVGEEGFRLSTSSEAEMEQLLSCLDDALDRLRQHSIEKKRRMIKRESKLSQTDSEAVIADLTGRLLERGVQKKTRAVEKHTITLEGSSSSMKVASMSLGNNNSINKDRGISLEKRTSPARTLSSVKAAPAKGATLDAWAPAVPFTAVLSFEKLDPAPLMGVWYVAAHLPYFLERNAHDAMLTLTLDAARSHVTAETRFADGGTDGAARFFVREGPIDEIGRDWRLRQRWGEGKLMPQTPLAVLHAGEGGMMLAHSHTVVADAHNHSIRKEDEVGVSYLWLLTRASPAAGSPPIVNEMLDLARDLGFDVGAIRTVPHKE